jgi:hypothetical protein
MSIIVPNFARIQGWSTTKVHAIDHGKRKAQVFRLASRTELMMDVKKREMKVREDERK